MALKDIKGLKINGDVCSLDLTKDDLTKLVSPNGEVYHLLINNDGELYALKENGLKRVDELGVLYDKTGNKLEGNYTYKMYINSLYCGGISNKETTPINYCSHNFVELSNLTGHDINLDGFTLNYGVNGNSWKTLKLKGMIKNGSTFLIRGNRCVAENSDACKIFIDDYDMEWDISFNIGAAKFYLCFGEPKSAVPYNASTSSVTDAGYVDLIGFANTDAYEVKPNNDVKIGRLFKKYYSMDPVKQATKDAEKRNNANDMTYIDLTVENGDIINNIEDYTPKASKYNKNLFYDKTNLLDGKPTVINCTFGIQATDNGSGATRCFAWVSKGTKTEYLWVRKEGSQTWNILNGVESISGQTGYMSKYNRRTEVYTNGAVFTSHKYILKGLIAGVYEYTAGKKSNDGTPSIENCTNIKKFTVRTDEDVNANGFRFVQTSDQQGFNYDEYLLWKYSCDTIMKENNESVDKLHFTINTGDMTQNGNRLNEWLDYFNGKESFSDIEEMATIGNNDLCLPKLTDMGGGEDWDKVSFENIDFFFTFEMDEDNLPIFSIPSYKKDDEGNFTILDKEVECYIPSLYSFNYGNTHFICLNSEIKSISETGRTVNSEHSNDCNVFGFGVDEKGKIYPYIKRWCENDFDKNRFDNNIAYCHEMPFTLLTSSVTQNTTSTIRSGGSNANDNMPTNDDMFWFSEFCQTHNVKLCIGGHKHTQTSTHPLLENVKYTVNENGSYVKVSDYYINEYRYILEGDDYNGLVRYSREVDSIKTEIVAPFVKESENFTDYMSFFNNSTDIVDNYPNNWGTEGDYLVLKHFSTFKYLNDINENSVFVDSLPQVGSANDNLLYITKNDGKMYKISNGDFVKVVGKFPVIYSMSQATGYKHTSNRDLPGPNIPWEKNYYATKLDETAPSPDQKFPFYTLWTVNDGSINGEVKIVKGIFDGNGKFNINKQLPSIKNGNTKITTERKYTVEINKNIF